MSWITYPDNDEKYVKRDNEFINKVLSNCGYDVFKFEYYGTGKRIKELIEDEYKTQPVFVEKFNEDPTYSLNIRNLSKWIGEETEPRKRNLLRVAELLDCDIEYLECKQNYRRNSTGKRKPFIFKPTKLESFLRNIKEIVNTESYSFDFRPDFKRLDYEVCEDYFIEGNYKFYYYSFNDVYDDEWSYEFKINDSPWIKLSEDRLKELVTRVERYIRFEIEQLK